MSLDANIRIRERVYCQNCGKIAGLGLIVEEIPTGGRCLYSVLQKIGYGDDQYGIYIEVSEENAKQFMNECISSQVYNWSQIENAICKAIVNKNAIEIEADW